jgi:hypothetical protein
VAGGHRGTRRPPARDCAHHFVMPVLRSTSPTSFSQPF